MQPDDESCTRCGATPETGQTEGCQECEGVVGPLNKSSAATGHELRREAIRRERETRHWTIPQWKEASPDEHWPTYIANVRREADAAVDSLIAEVEAMYARESA